MSTKHAAASLVVCVERESSFRGGAQLAASRMVQQIEPTWQTVWGHKAEERHVRTLQLSSKEAPTSELQDSLNPRAFVCVLLSWDDLDGTAALNSHADLLLRMERLTGRMPVVAISGHAESRGCLEMCSPEIANTVRRTAWTQRLLRNLMSFHQRMNRCHQNMFFSVFAQLACEEVPVPCTPESVTVIAEYSELLQGFCQHLVSCMTEAGLDKKPVKQLCIMSRDDEFSLNAKSMYVVVVQGEGEVIASNSPDGDYRSILHRILFHTGRLPILALSGPICAEQKLSNIFEAPAINQYVERASYFPESPNAEHTRWLVSALRAEMLRTSPPKSHATHAAPIEAASASSTNAIGEMRFDSSDNSQCNGSMPTRTQAEHASSPVSSLHRRIADTQIQIHGLQSNVDGENLEKNRLQTTFSSNARASNPSSPSVSDVEKALKQVISRGGKPLPAVPDQQRADDLLLDLQEAQPAKTYTDLLLSRQGAGSLAASSQEAEDSHQLVSRAKDKVQDSSSWRTGVAFDTAKSSSFVDAWSHLENLKRDHEQAMRAERERTSQTAGAEGQDLLAKANTLTLRAEEERQALIQKIKIQEELQEQNSRLERLKQEASTRAEAARIEELRLAAVSEAEREAAVQKESAERAAQEARYRELESKALNRGVQHLDSRQPTLEVEVVYEVPRSGQVDMSRSDDQAALSGKATCEAHANLVPSSPSLSPPPVSSAKGGSWVPALAALAGMEASETPSQIPSPEKFATHDPDRIRATAEEKSEHENNAEEKSEHENNAGAGRVENSPSRSTSGNQLRQSALSDHETLPHERSPLDERDAQSCAVKEQAATTQRSRPLPVPPSSLDPLSTEATAKSNVPVTPIVPRVLVPVDRDSSNTREVPSSGTKSVPRVIARRPSSLSHDAPQSPAAVCGPRVLSHRLSTSTAASLDCTPFGSPRLRQSDDPSARDAQPVIGDASVVVAVGGNAPKPHVNSVSGEGESEDVEECSDYPASPKTSGEDDSVAVSVSSKSPSPPRPSTFANRNNSDTGDSARVGIGLTLTLDPALHQYVVTGLEPSSSAAKSLAGIGDIVHSIDGREVQEMDEATVNSMLVGIAHSAVVLGLKHEAGSDVSDVVIIRVPKSGAAHGLESSVADAETHNLGSMGSHGSRRSTLQHSPPGILWASLRAQVDMFADDQTSDEGLAPKSDRADFERAMQSQGWLVGAPRHSQHRMVRTGQHAHGPSARSALHPQLHASGAGYSGDTIRAMPSNRVGPAPAPHAYAQPHSHAHMGPPHHHGPPGHSGLQQQPWAGSMQAASRKSGGLSNQPTLLPPKQQQHINQRLPQIPQGVVADEQPAAPGSSSSHITTHFSQPHTQPAQGGFQDTSYDAWLQHMEQSVSTQHPSKQPQPASQLRVPPAPQALAQGNVAPAHQPPAGHQSVSTSVAAGHWHARPEAAIQTDKSGSPDETSVHSSVKSAPDLSEDASDIMDIPSSTQNEDTGEVESNGAGAGGVAPFQAPPPAAATPAKAPALESRGNFGFQVAQIIDKKRESVGDYDSMRVSFVAQEGAARFSGHVIKGDYLLRVNQKDLRSKPLGEVMDAIQDAPTKSTFEFLDGKQGKKNSVTLVRELRGREDLFVERLHRMLTGTTDMKYLSFLRQNSAFCSKEEYRASFVVCGFPGVGKSTLINTMLAAVNSCDYSVADASTPSMQYTRYEQVLRGADNNPFIIADTAGLTGDESVFASLRNIVKGRHKNNTRMDNSWRSIKTVADSKKRVHGLILVADARQKVSGSIVDALNEICAAEDDLPAVVAWTNLLETPSQEVTERMRSMLAAFPRAVNFPVLHYKPGQSGVANVDYTVLDMLSHLRTQSLRYIKYSQQEASVKL